MLDSIDFFFSPYPTAQQRRLRAAHEDGLAHGSRMVSGRPEVDKAVTLLFSAYAQHCISHVGVYYTTDGSEPAGSQGHATHGMLVYAEKVGEIIEQDGACLQQWQAVIPPQPEGTLVRYRADGWNDAGECWIADYVDPVSSLPAQGRIFAYHVNRWIAPEWWHDAIVYEIFVDRFHTGHHEISLLAHDETDITDFFGGTLAGILEKLDYLQELGVNCLWLSPVFESPSHHGYNPSDHYRVAQRFGTNEALKQLIQEAHRRGIHVLLDFVANHTSDQHELFLAALEREDASSIEWYALDTSSPHGFRSYANVSSMPELVTDHPEVQHYMAEVALHWLGDFGADGLRLDYASGPSHAFWADFQRVVKERFPEALTIGEITAPIDEIATYAGRIDAFMDFPLARVLREVFARRISPLSTLLAYLEERQVRNPAGMSTGILLDNHDMHRFLWLAQGEKQRLELALTCLFTLVGTPIIYYGTEVGLSQYGDAHKENAHARAPMLWGERQDQALFQHVQQCIKLRQRSRALRYGAHYPLSVHVLNSDERAESQVGAFLRVEHEELAVVALNNYTETVTTRIHLPENMPNVRKGQFIPVYPTSDLSLSVDETEIEVTLPALSGCVLMSNPITI